MKNRREKWKHFWEKRNGVDELGVFLTGLSFALLLLSALLGGLALALAGVGFLIYAYFRAVSGKAEKRREENRNYLAVRETLRFRLQSRSLRLKMLRTNRYVKCKKCGQKMRVPRKKGRIEVTCPKCGETKILKS